MKWEHNRESISQEEFHKSKQLFHRAEYLATMTGNYVDPAFQTISPRQTNFIIWRVEMLQLVAIPKEAYGKFYDGDSYIIYAASERNQPCGPDIPVRDAKGSLDAHIHFWIGAETSQDESAVAAIKTVELDDYLGGFPVQHRETQGSESGRFKGYFRHGIRILNGGIASGLHHVVNDTRPRLYRVKGRRSPTLTQLTSISWDNFNDGDVFIFVASEVVYVWIGKEANRMEKMQAAIIASKLKDEADAQSVIFVDSGMEDRHLMPRERRIWSEHGLAIEERQVASAASGGQDEIIEKDSSNSIILYQCTDENGTCRIIEVKNGPLYQSDLNPNDSFIIDGGASGRGVWAWVGRRASKKEREEAMRNANGFIREKNYPSSTHVTRVIDGGEPTEFKGLFISWTDRVPPTTTRQPSRTAVTVHSNLDAATLHARPIVAANAGLLDDGSGKRKVWRIGRNGDLIEIPAQMHGVFFGGDCYIVKYEYQVGSKRNIILYYWLGLHSSTDERGYAAIRTVELDDAEGGAAIQVRVVQSKEPPHFKAIFKGRMLVFQGGLASQFDGDGAQDQGIPETYLLHVRGNESYNTTATQVEMRAASLNSNDVFVLKTSQNCWVWCGKGSTGDEREMAKSIASRATTREINVVQEGMERDDFWSAIGGQEEYADSPPLTNSNLRLPPRLFQCSNASGAFKAEEIYNFVQADLVPQDVMLLDARDYIFIWIGKDSNKEEKQLSIELAFNYLKTDPSGRDIDTPIFKVHQGNEPPTFTGFFGVWDDNLWEKTKNYEQIRDELVQLNLHRDQDTPLFINKERHFDDFPKFPLVILQGAPDTLPENVDAVHRELHLSQEEFQDVFEMDYSAFINLPAWRQQKLKKDKQIF